MSSPRRRSRSFHRWLGLLLAAPVLVWTATGLLFLLQPPGWDGAYEWLEPFRKGAPGSATAAGLDPGAWISPAEALERARSGGEGGERLVFLEAGETALGPVYRLELAGEPSLADGASSGPDATSSPRRTVLVHARTGEVLSPLSAPRARALAVDAGARSGAPERYGEVLAVEEDEDLVEVRLASRGGAGSTTGATGATAATTVTVDRHRMTLSQRGIDTERIDLLYRLHYLRWTGLRGLDQGLAIGALLGTWGLVVLGLVLLRRRQGPAG